MKSHLLRRRLDRGKIAVLAALPAAGLLAMSAGASASPAPAPAVSNPYSPAYHHAYRHGVVPTIATAQKMKQWAGSHPQAASAASSPNDLNYGGGIDGIGVTTGPEKVYLVFYGTQWGTQSTDSNGDVTLSGDPSGEAPYDQEFFKGLGTNNELWSGVMTQYCQGVAAGTQICPASNTQHVGYPTGGALAGVWVDESTASPATASGHQLGVEAVNAAAHFGNTTAAANRDSQYVILSPTGANPDNWLTQGFCAWHDYNGDSTLSGGAVSSPYGDIAFTNMPYQTDAGASCGQDFVNSNGTLDGVSIVNGHEYAETITDQNPAGGYTDSSGAENGDKCAWITPGTSGGSFDLTTATGTFAVQTTWANDGASDSGSCEGSHPIVTNPSGTNTVTVTSPGNQSGTVGSAVSLQISATDSASGQTLTFSASGLPAGLSISSSGLISGTPTTAATSSVTVTATDTTGAHGSASFTWTISNPAGNTVTVTSPGNQSGTVGTAVSLQIHATDSASGQTLNFSASGLPAGLSISSSGQISGKPTTAATSSVTVTATDTTGAHGSATFTWTISTSGGCTTHKQLLGNPGFETGSAAPWTSTAGVINANGAGEIAHSGNWYAWLDGYGIPHTDTLSQTVTIPAGCTATSFSFWLHIDTLNTDASAEDILTVTANGTTIATFSNLNAINGYAQHTYSLGSFAGKSVTVKFSGTEIGNGETSFVVDDTAINTN